MNLCNETEYFGFAPLIFIRELIEEVMQTAETQIKSTVLCTNTKIKNAILNFIQQSISKNFYLFQNYVIRAVFAFPANFHHERKITDLRCDENIQKLVNELFQIFEEEKYLRSELIKLEGDYEIEMYKKKMYEKLLLNENEIIESIKKTRKMKSLCEETDLIYAEFVDKKIIESARKSNTVEFKDIKIELLKNERDRCVCTAEIDDLLFYSKNID